MAYDRTFRTNGGPPSRQLSLIAGKQNADREYTCTGFDTWNGLNLATATARSSPVGELRFVLPRFPVSRDAAARGVADGNDIATRIEAARK
jgi:hypothetical protein